MCHARGRGDTTAEHARLVARDGDECLAVAMYASCLAQGVATFMSAVNGAHPQLDFRLLLVIVGSERLSSKSARVVKHLAKSVSSPQVVVRLLTDRREHAASATSNTTKRQMQTVERSTPKTPANATRRLLYDPDTWGDDGPWRRLFLSLVHLSTSY